MPRKQYRRSISMSRSTYDAIGAYAATVGSSMSAVVEHVLSLPIPPDAVERARANGRNLLAAKGRHAAAAAAETRRVARTDEPPSQARLAAEHVHVMRCSFGEAAALFRCSTDGIDYWWRVLYPGAPRPTAGVR
jgi:hypothetical protein